MFVPLAPPHKLKIPNLSYRAIDYLAPIIFLMPDNKTLVYLSGDESLIQFWDLSTNTPHPVTQIFLHSLKLILLLWHSVLIAAKY